MKWVIVFLFCFSLNSQSNQRVVPSLSDEAFFLEGTKSLGTDFELHFFAID
jgi:hypothetical protein